MLLQKKSYSITLNNGKIQWSVVGQGEGSTVKESIQL